MQFQKQAFRHDPDNGIHGDCWRTAIACILGLDRDAVPHTHSAEPGELSGTINGFIQDRGLDLFSIYIDGSLTVKEALIEASKFQKHPFMFIGESRTGTNHVVIAQDGEIIHDPSQVDSGIIGPTIEDGVYIAEWLIYHPARLSA